MSTHLDISGLPVNKTKCATCPFGDTNDRTIEAKVIERCFTGMASQICHGTEGPNREPRSLCRGMRDIQLQVFHRIGFLESETDEAWEKRRSLSFQKPLI